MNDYLLIDGTQIPVTSELAQVVGLNEAIVLQEVFYWCKVNRREKRPPHDGYYWVFNSYQKWQKNHFPWWSVSTIRRTFEKLEANNLLVVGNYNKSKMDQTKWYRVNFPVLAETIKSSPFAQNEQMDLLGLNKPIPEVKPERNENGISPTQVSENSLSDLVKNGLSSIDIDAFINWYYMLYQSERGKPHPKIKPQQKARVVMELTNFLSDPDYSGIDMEGLQDMARDFFDSMDATETDWNINHFATNGILKCRYYDVYVHGYYG